MSSDAPSTTPQTFINRHLELIIAILLGLVSIVTAYASFQRALYDGQTPQKYTIGSNLATEAESLYLEGNQQYVQDAQLYDRLTDLQLDIANPDPAVRRHVVDHMLQCVEIGRRTGSELLSLWFADGTNYPGQGDFRSRKQWVSEGLQEVYAAMPPQMRMPVQQVRMQQRPLYVYTQNGQLVRVR